MILELLDLTEDRERTWSTLSDAERELNLGKHFERAHLSMELSRYLEIQDRIAAVSRVLREQEVEKIRQALAALDAWLASRT
jgi:hypothetical protein